jgi:hypothetical protein
VSSCTSPWNRTTCVCETPFYERKLC